MRFALSALFLATVSLTSGCGPEDSWDRYFVSLKIVNSTIPAPRVIKLDSYRIELETPAVGLNTYQFPTLFEKVFTVNGGSDARHVLRLGEGVSIYDSHARSYGDNYLPGANPHVLWNGVAPTAARVDVAFSYDGTPEYRVLEGASARITVLEENTPYDYTIYGDHWCEGPGEEDERCDTDVNINRNIRLTVEVDVAGALSY